VWAAKLLRRLPPAYTSPSPQVPALQGVAQIGDHDFVEDWRCRVTFSIGTNASTGPSKLRGIQSAELMNTFA